LSKYTPTYYFFGDFAHWEINNFLIFQAISSSVTELAKPKHDDPDEHRKHLPTPQLRLFARDDAKQRKDEKPAWKAVVDERLQQKTRRFNSVSRLPFYF